MTKNQSIEVNSRINEALPCRVPGCSRHRDRISPYCALHARNRWFWGHPEGTQILDSEYKAQLQEVRSLINANPDHPGVKYAIDYLNRWMVAAETLGAGPCPERVARFRGVVNPLDILVELAAVWVFGKEHTPDRVKDDRHMRHLLGSKMLTFGKRDRELYRSWGSRKPRVTGKEAREAGRLLLVEIGDLLNTIYRAVLERRKAQAVKADVQKQRFA